MTFTSTTTYPGSRDGSATKLPVSSFLTFLTVLELTSWPTEVTSEGAGCLKIEISGYDAVATARSGTLLS